MSGKKKIEGSGFTPAECDAFVTRVSAISVERYRVLRPIYGITLPQGCDAVSVGGFTIYEANKRLEEIKQRGHELLLDQRIGNASGFLIECEVDARDTVKAEELADLLFYRFELIIRFMIGHRTRWVEVGVLNYVGPQLRDRIVVSTRDSAVGSAWQGALQPIPISDAFFCEPSRPFAKLLGLVSDQRNKLQQHIMRCVEWTAQAVRDPSEASAFVKAAIALEVLFSPNEKGIITPSIMAQIAESCAFLLGNSPESAANIEGEVKRLYGIRSAVVHSGKDSVGKRDLNLFIQMCRNCVLTLLSKKALEKIDTPGALAEHLRTKKYTGCQPEASVEDS